MKRIVPFLAFGLITAAAWNAHSHNPVGPSSEGNRQRTTVTTTTVTTPMPQQPALIRGDDNTEIELREVGPFSAISVEGPFEVEIDAQYEPRVRVVADNNLIPHIVTQVEGETLRIYSPTAFETDDTLRVEINVRDLDRIAANGEARVDIENLNNSKLTVAASDNALVKVSGRTTELDATLSDNATLKASHLRSHNAIVRQTDASHAEVYASRSLNLDVTDGSKLFYYGSPNRIEKRVTGTASLNPRRR